MLRSRDVPRERCGDGVCADDESPETCPTDCPTPEEEVFSCLLDSCDTGLCLNFPLCEASLACLAACTDVACGQACIAAAPAPAQGILESVALCGVEAGCWEAAAPEGCGDGICKDGETLDLCPEDCPAPGIALALSVAVPAAWVPT